ncbi:hypothetical protein [Paenibacillus medicaginis]|uniref:Uncharacterized protein n=1 Tax=Paenibacillus medicaginis TaxID=1470560 RepID=A0ABV5BUZ3_9BACL
MLNISQLQTVDCIEDAEYISFDVNLEKSGITRDKLYKVEYDQPIGIVPCEGFEYINEHYFMNDCGIKTTQVWIFYKTKYYK